jgi:replicative DNA helicase
MITYISSKSGQGKTQFALRMALEASNIANNVLIVSYEMDSKHILKRISSVLENDIHQPKEISVIQCDASDNDQFQYEVFSNQLEQWMNYYGSVILDGFFTNLGDGLDDRNMFLKR